MAVGEGGVLKTGCFYQLRYVLGEGCSFHAVMDSFSQVEGLNYGWEIGDRLFPWSKIMGHYHLVFMATQRNRTH